MLHRRVSEAATRAETDTLQGLEASEVATLKALNSSSKVSWVNFDTTARLRRNAVTCF